MQLTSEGLDSVSAGATLTKTTISASGNAVAKASASATGDYTWVSVEAQADDLRLAPLRGARYPLMYLFGASDYAPLPYGIE
jgi:hypothetical protein